MTWISDNNRPLLLMAIPAFLAMLLVVAYIGTGSSPSEGLVSSFSEKGSKLRADNQPTVQSKSTITPEEALKIVLEYEAETDDCTSCSTFIESTCSSAETPVLLGLDVVQYFTEFALPDGSGYNESLYGKYDNLYQHQYKGLTYSFVSEENRNLFIKNPEKYIPQYGGFCALGVSTEFCPKFPWAKDCMGPGMERRHWTIYKNKLYFFWYSGAKENFLANVDYNIAIGDARWEYYYGKNNQGPMNTVCVVDN